MKTDSFRDKLYPLELSLLLAVCVTLLMGLRAGAAQQALAEKVVRLHVVAVSDTAEDQAVKLRVRDAVLAQVEPALASADSPEAAQRILRAMLPELENTARWISGQERVSVSLGREHYPTRHYDTFSLPAGEYTSLRVELGAARGQNWWCVVYPPLCGSAPLETVRETVALDEEDLRLITEDGEEYEIRFRLMELWGELTAKINR